MDDVTHRDVAFGLAGLAILRRLPHDPAGIRDIVAMYEALDFGQPLLPSREVDPITGYAEWSKTYDEGTNPMVAIEEPVVARILADRLPTRALDAACGTGRWSRRLAELGWQVVGVDASNEMLEVARAKVPDAEFDIGALDDLPLPDDDVDLTVCALALTHVADLATTFKELARVTAPGGLVVTTDVHPFATELGAHAVFAEDDSERRFMRNRTHSHSAYLNAFAEAGLELVGCHEPIFRPELANNPMAAWTPTLVERAIGGLPGVLIWVTRVSSAARPVG